MSQTALELYNMALAQVGHDVTLSALGGSTTEELRCVTFIGSARRTVFAFFDWKWLAADATLAFDVTNPVQTGPLYVFTMPTDTLRVLKVTDAYGMPVVYDVVGTKIKSDCAAITVRYIADVADPATWPTLIYDAVACELAARICVPMTGNFERAKELRAQAGLYIREAAAQYAPEGEQEQQADRQKE